MKRISALGLVLCVAMAVPSAFAQRRNITEKDILKFKWVANPQISPDGKEVAYVLVSVSEKDDRYETSIWCVATTGSAAPRRLTAGPRDSSPRWSPDSKTLAFNRKSIAFTSSSTKEDVEQKKSGKPPEKKSDVRVVTQAIYRFNGGGYLDPTHHSHIWTVPVDLTHAEPTEAKQLTSGKYDEGEIEWSRDESKIYFVSDRVDEPYYLPPDSNAYWVSAAGGEIQPLIDIDGPIGSLTASPDGTKFAFTGFINPPKVQSHTVGKVFVWAGGKATNLKANYDAEIGSGITGDQHAPRGGASQPIVWTPDGRTLILATTDKGRSNLVRIDVAAAKVEMLTTGDHDLMSFSATPDASRFAISISDTTHIGDVFLFEPATKQLTQLTHLNDELQSQLNLTPPEEFWYTSFDGKKINTWVQKPPDFDSSKKYPLILNIHGGPHAAYGHTFFHEMQWMAAKGYVVLYPNPRGSTTYGQDFANIIQWKYPGDDYKDLMIGVDELIKRGYIDEKRLGVTGGSGGGLLTNWTITQTNRFAAAVSQRSVADWIAFWYTADFTLFTPSWFQSVPYKNPEEFLGRSPVRFAEKITTPLMLVEGEDDLRTPPTQGGEAMFRALKMQKKPVVMVRFPGETHELSRSGRPTHRIERLQHIVSWFDKYLLGKDIKTYDLQ
ncbi:MAG: S9 family peptidase [Acidobacteria bacterium]|nr:S9 family peptidase [Acidobacteriota bacterium]